MSTQLLIPFKATFILSVRTTMKNFFSNPNETSFEEMYAKVKDDSGSVDIVKYIYFHHLSFYLYKKYQPIYFKYNKALDVYPPNILAEDRRDSQLSFKLESYEVEVLQIIGKQITFANSEKEVHTFELDDNLTLIKKEDYKGSHQIV